MSFRIFRFLFQIPVNFWGDEPKSLWTQRQETPRIASRDGQAHQIVPELAFLRNEIARNVS